MENNRYSKEGRERGERRRTYDGKNNNEGEKGGGGGGSLLIEVCRGESIEGERKRERKGKGKSNQMRRSVI